MVQLKRLSTSVHCLSMSLIDAPSLGIRSDIGLNYDKVLFNLNQQQFGVRYNYQRFNYAKVHLNTKGAQNWSRISQLLTMHNYLSY